MTTQNDSASVKVAGDIMTGLLVLSGDPSTALGACTKQYADAISVGIDFKQACFCATTGALTVTYSNGAAGIGATLTNAGAQAAFSVDGQTPAVASRVLVKNQAAPAQNGIYTVTNAGSGSTNWVLTRSTDYNTAAQIFPGTLIPVDNGTVNGTTSWIQTATVVTIGTDSITFTQFTYGSNLPVSAGGTGLQSATAYAVLTGGTTSTGAFQSVASVGTSGQRLTSNGASALPTFQTDMIGLVVNQNSSSVTLAAGSVYVINNGASLVTLTLPATAAIGDVFVITGGSAGGWTIAQNSGQIIHVGSTASTTGASGSVASSNRYDCITLRCVVTNNEFSSYAIQGNLTVV